MGCGFFAPEGRRHRRPRFRPLRNGVMLKGLTMPALKQVSSLAIAFIRFGTGASELTCFSAAPIPAAAEWRDAERAHHAGTEAGQLAGARPEPYKGDRRCPAGSAGGGGSRRRRLGLRDG